MSAIYYLWIHTQNVEECIVQASPSARLLHMATGLIGPARDETI